MGKPTIVTGDDIAIPVTLKKDGATFAIDAGATIKARLVSSDHKTTYSDEIDQSNVAPGADWDNSLVVVAFGSAETVEITHQGVAALEIQVDDSGKRTWFVTVNIVKGNIG